MIYIVLPTYNEDKTILKLLNNISVSMKESFLNYYLIAVNDGSTDLSLSEIKKFKHKKHLKLVNHSKNLGLAEAIKTGLITANKISKNEDIVIMMDADNTHTPGLIIKMVRMIREGNDVVIASRFQKDSRVLGVPLNRKILSVVGSLVFKLLFPIHGVRDYTCGYRAYKASILKKAFKFYGNDFVSQSGFSAMVDILLKLRQFEIVISEAPLILRYDFKKSKSKMNVGKTIVETIKLIIRRKLNLK